MAAYKGAVVMVLEELVDLDDKKASSKKNKGMYQKEESEWLTFKTYYFVSFSFYSLLPFRVRIGLLIH